MARFEELHANGGVDTNKPILDHGRTFDGWMMVPLGGTNLVCLSDGAVYPAPVESPLSGRKLKEVTEIPAKAVGGVIGSFLRPNCRIFRISGSVGGETWLEAKKGKETATLKISVHPSKRFKLAFFFLQDKDAAGNVKTRTTFSPSDADRWVPALNDVFGPQANIWFEKAMAEFLPLEKLSFFVGANDDVAKMADKKVPGADIINIFIAGSQIQSLDGDYPLGFFDRHAKIIVVKDQSLADPWAANPAPMLATIAHEIGHFMYDARGIGGKGHNYYVEIGYKSDILNALSGDDIKIPRQRVLDWNPWQTPR